MENNKQVAVNPVNKLKQVMSSPSVLEQFKNALAENSNLFVASLIDLYASDTYLQQCDPSQVVMEALKAATLKLPINKSLGFAYIVPYKKQGRQIPQFQLGYKGMIQLAMRSGIYRYLNAGTVYEGQYRGYSILTGELDLCDQKTSDDVVGYFAYIESVNGFKKSIFCTRDDMEKHAKKYSKSFTKDSSPWQTEFDGMAEKTMLRRLLGKYGLMSVEMAEGLIDTSSDFDDDYRGQSNATPIDLVGDDHGIMDGGIIDQNTGEITGDDPPPPSQEREERTPSFAV